MLELKRPGLSDPADIRDITDNFDGVVAWAATIDNSIATKANKINPAFTGSVTINGISVAISSSPTFITLAGIIVSGYVSIGSYSKDQFGFVSIEGRLTKSTGYLTDSTVLATLPIGFRPRVISDIIIPVTTLSGTVLNSPVSSIIISQSTGNISIHTPPSTSTACLISAHFFAS